MKTIRHPFFLLLTFVVFLAGTAHGGISTWNGSGADANWGTVGNWDMPPMANDELVFNGAPTARPVNTNDYPADTVFGGISFNSGNGAFNIK
jgi:hypothetical protein